MLKTRRFGYDGKGQAKIMTPADAATAWAAMRGQPSILEGFVNFRAEVSVVAARGIDGEFSAFPVTENEHRDHILYRSIAPARVSAAAGAEAVAIARRIAEALDYVGVFAIEFFVVANGGGDRLYVNEMAPACTTPAIGRWTGPRPRSSSSTFAPSPAGRSAHVAMTAPGAEMINLIGDEIQDWQSIAAEPGAYLHHYGKREARPGRKMGHVNRLLAKPPL